MMLCNEHKAQIGLVLRRIRVQVIATSQNEQTTNGAVFSRVAKGEGGGRQGNKGENGCICKGERKR